MKQKNGKDNKGKGKAPLKSQLIAKKAKEGKTLKVPDNPFDKFSNARKKHEVLNRKVKGEDRNVGRARAKAIDERKSKLLKEYNTNKKSNTFLDKRFGESDANISLEEKMFMRFQQERVKKVRNSSLFNLDSNDTELLTHKGQALGDSNMDDRDYFSSDEEGGGKLDKEVVNKLHFGGGMVQSNNNREEEEAPRRGRLDALQEIVMKSKLHKLQKKEAKEEQEDERDKLDKAYDDLFASSQVQLDQPIQKRRFRGEEELDPLDSYDVSLREMAFETKVQPSDRTKTPEEIALAEQQKIEELEKARLKRMKQVENADDDKEEERTSGVVVNSTTKKRKHITDDQIGESDYMTPRERKAAKNAAMASKVSGGDDLEDEEYGDSEEDENEDEDEEEESEEGSDEEDDEEGEDDDNAEEGDEEVDQDEEYSDEEEEEGDEEEDVYDEPLDYDEQPEDDKKKNKKRSTDDDGESDGTDNSGDEDEEEGGRFNRRRPKKSTFVDDGVNINMPHKIKCPVDLESFDDLVDEYVRSDKDLFALVDRILAWNSVHLPGAQGAENRNLMHNFLDILLKHFIRVGDSLANHTNETEVTQHLDYLSVTIFSLSQTLGDSCVPLWGRTLKIMQSQLQKRLRDYSLGNRDSCWPSLGRLLLLQQLGRVFSVTDLKNEIVSPATLFLCQCLSQCPVATVKDIASGILAINIILGYTAETQRFVPELLSFVHTLLSQYLVGSSTNKDKQLFQTTFNASSLSWLRVKASENSSIAKLSWNSFASKPTQPDNETASAILSIVYTLIEELISRNEYSSAFTELFDPILVTLRSLKPQATPILVSIQQRHVNLIEKIITKSNAGKESRKPLQWRKSVTVSIDMKTPRFELDYTFKKDSDPDRERVQLKQLTRQLKREKKAAMRELRRDSAFIDSERYKEVTAAKEKRRDERVKNFAWMEEQQATVNQQVRQGKGLMKGGGSSIAKKSRPKRL